MDVAMASVDHSSQTRKRPRPPSVTNLTVFCCLVGSNTPFSVRISSSLTVDELKEMIKEKKPNDLKEIDADKLSLFKVSIPDEDDLAQKLEDAVKASKPLRSTTELTEIFPDKPLKRTIHIGVKLPDDAPPSSSQGRGQNRVQLILDSAADRSAPSTAAKLSEQRKFQDANHADAVYNHRPLELIGPPITIYHPVFSKFIHAMSVPPETLVFTDAELNEAMLLVQAGCEFYDHEDRRRDKFHGIYGGGFLLGSTITYTNAHQEHGIFKADAFKRVICSLMPRGVEAYPNFEEFKNEIGEGGSDPIAQAECDYVTIVTSEGYTFLRQACCCPSLLVGVAGPNLTVSGAVFTGQQLVSQRLTDYIYLGPLPSDGSLSSPHHKQICRVAQFIRARGDAIKELETFYKELRLQPHPRDGGFCSPHFDRYSIGQDTFQITYLERLCPNSPEKAVFKAEVKNIASRETCEVAVKFTYSYDKAGHELLARQSLAPALYYCEREVSVGGMFVVVMDWVTGEHFSDATRDSEVIQSLRTAVKVLHEHNHVFGDLRAPNVLVKWNEKTVRLVDFDWCGLDNSARYPFTINMEPDAAVWHPGTKRGGLIAKAHDAHMFHVLTGVQLDG